MKKSFLFSVALAAALSSCSKDSSIDNESNGGNGNLNPNAPVAINLGAGGEISAGVEPASKSSRGVVSAWNNTKVGIFALSTKGGWDNSSDASNPTVLWNNVEGTVASAETVTVKTNGQPGYYPNGGTLNYSFYGYCLTDKATDITTDWTAPTVTAQTVKTTFTIDGTNDILWGKAEAPQLNGKGDDSGNKYDGYNATYFRKGDGAATPKITFGHLLTQLQFHVKKSDTFEAGQQLYLKSITVKQVPTQFDMTIADVSGTNGAGKITPNTDSQTGDLLVSNISEGGIEISSLNTFTAVGDPIMLYSDGTSTKTYNIEVVLAGGPDSGSSSSPNPVTITAPNSAAYAVGKAYKVNLTINSLKEIKVEATLTPWKNEDTPIEGEI